MQNDQQSQRTAVAVLAAVLTVVLIVAFVTTFQRVDTGSVANETPPGTTGLARPHPPLDRAPGEPIHR
jgi:hypothetical protein